MQVGRLQATALSRDIACRNAYGATHGDGQVGEVATYTGTLQQYVTGTRAGVGAADDILQMGMGPVTDGLYTLVAGWLLAKLTQGNAGKTVRLAVAARVEIGECLFRQLSKLNFIDLPGIFQMRLQAYPGAVVQCEVTALHVQAQYPVVFFSDTDKIRIPVLIDADLL